MLQMPALGQPPGEAREDIWEQHRPTFQQLYQAQRRTLSEVKAIVERDHGFPATPLSTYESKLRQMRVRKKMKKTDWHAVYQELQRRGERKSAVYLCGTKIPSTNAWKEIRRSGARSSDNGQRSQLPREVVVRTPSPGRQSPPLPLVFRCRNVGSSSGVLSSQASPTLLQNTTRLPQDTRLRAPTEMRVLDLPDTISDFHKSFLKYTPSYLFKLELSRIFEKSSTIRSMARSDHVDLRSGPRLTSALAGINSNPPITSTIQNVPSFQTARLTIPLRHLSEMVYMLSNNLFSGEDEQRSLEFMFTYLPTSVLIQLSISNLHSLRVVFDQALKYLFRNDRRDDFQALLRTIAHHHPDWLASDVDRYLFYAAAMNCLDACRLLLETIVKAIPPDYVAKQLNTEYALYVVAILSAVSAGYFDCVRLLIRHKAPNCRLPRDCDCDTSLPAYQIGNHGVVTHNPEYADNQVTPVFLHTVAAIRRGKLRILYSIGNIDREIPLRFEMDTVQHAFNIFSEFGLNVDALIPPWFDEMDQFPGTNDLRVLCLHTDFRTPIHLRPTVLDVLYYLDKDSFHYFAHHSKKVNTGLTRSGLYLTAERGSGSLHQYLNASCSRAPGCQELLEMVLAESLSLNFDPGVAHALLSRGVGFGAFPQDLNLSLPLERLIIEIRLHGLKLEVLNIFNQLLREGATIDADVMAAAVEPHGTDLLKFLSGYGADFAASGTSALFVSAMLDNYEAVDWLLEAGVDINTDISLGHDEAISVVGGLFKYFGDRDDIRQRFESLYDIYFEARDRESAFEFAPSATASMLKYIIGRAAVLRTHPGNLPPNSVLFHAITLGMHRSDILDMVTYLLEAQGGFHNSLRSQPCLLEACFLRHINCSHGKKEVLTCGLPIFNLLLASGVPIVNSGVLSRLIYHGATIELVQMVIDRGASTNRYSNRTPYYALDYASQKTPPQVAASVGNLELLKALIDNGAEINLPAKGDNGTTALQAACKLPCLSGEERSTKAILVNFLINNGADVNAPASPKYGLTALQVAASLGDIETAAVLLDHGAVVNAPAGEVLSRCALDIAAYHGRLDMTKFLLDLGALSWDRGENDYAGAIELAERYGHWAVADLLREQAILCKQIRSAIEGDGL
ncbi:hypothetical protein F5B21DRAFT_472580 [Xylaria acuta]|nr:hypothetical protein F5B21DRAFT_472580 [Xylaria acuta]